MVRRMTAFIRKTKTKRERRKLLHAELVRSSNCTFHDPNLFKNQIPNPWANGRFLQRERERERERENDSRDLSL